ncbi:MAG: ribosome maturation factor [Bacteroidetes bacterium]|nr:ribosome maturation factor [Bacteroidota bacterium]
MTPQQQIADFIDQILEGSDCFLVEYKVKPTNNYKIFIDSDSGFTLEKAISINRRIRKQVEEAALYPEGDYSLEVSSPGVDTPLKLKRQFVKNIGRKLEIELLNEEAKGIVGRLVKVGESELVVEEIAGRQNKKPVDALVKVTVPLAEIKSALVLIEF